MISPNAAWRWNKTKTMMSTAPGTPVRSVQQD